MEIIESIEIAFILRTFFRPLRFLPYFVHDFTIAQGIKFVFFNELIVVYCKFIRYFVLN